MRRLRKLEMAKKYTEKLEDIVIIVGYAGDFHKPARIVVITADETQTFQIGACSWFWGRLNKEKKHEFKQRIIRDIKLMSELLDEFKRKEMFIAFVDKNSQRLFDLAMRELEENKIYECL